LGLKGSGVFVSPSPLRITVAILLALFMAMLVVSEAIGEANTRDMGFLAMVILPFMICACVGAAIGERRCATKAGFLWGLILGPVGWIVTFFIDNRPECSACRSRVHPEATVCPHCRQSFQ